MESMRNIGLFLIGLLLILILMASATFTVDQREYALVKRLGEVISVKQQAGLFIRGVHRGFGQPLVPLQLGLDRVNQSVAVQLSHL